MADDPYEDWRLPWRGAAIAAVGGAVLLAGGVAIVSNFYDTSVRSRVQVWRQEYPAPRLEAAHVMIGPRRSAEPQAIARAMAEEARGGWSAR